MSTKTVEYFKGSAWSNQFCRIESRFPSGQVKGFSGTAMHLLRAGNDMNMVRYWLGHASINTTHAYVKIDIKKMNGKMLQNAPAPAVKKLRYGKDQKCCGGWIDSPNSQNYVK